MKSKATDKPNMESQPGQGQPKTVSDEMFLEILEGLKSIRAHENLNVWTRRAYSDRTRYCIWPNQSPDGKKRKAHEWDREPEPFNGASDARVRLVDLVINIQVAMLMAATKASNLRINSIHVGDPKVAGYMQTYCSWLLNSKIIGEWELETERLANYGLGDSPAVALMHVYWEQEAGVHMVEFSQEEFMAEVAKLDMELDEEMLADVEGLFANPERSEELLSVLRTRFPHLKLPMLRASLGELQTEGRASFPEPYLLRNEPCVEAMRILEDVYVPTGTKSPRRCRRLYRREWYSRAELENMVTTGELDREFVDLLLEHGDGKSSYPQHVDGWSNTTGEDHIRYHNPAEYKGLYEVIYAYIRAHNDDGHIGEYILPFSEFVKDRPGSKMRLMDYPDGKKPFVWYVREATTRRLLDARGWSELLISDQAFLKTLRDLSSDHACISGLPPFLTDAGITEQDYSWKSLGFIRKRRNQRMDPVKFNDLPRSIQEQKQEIRQMVSLYTGTPLEDINELIMGLLQQSAVDRWLGVIKQIILKILQMAVVYDPEGFVRISGAEGDLDMDALKRSVQDLPDVEIDFNVDRFNLEYIKSVGTIIKDILLAMDTDQTIIRSEAVAFLAQELSPRFAQAVTRPVEGAAEAEVKDEQMNFALIMSGVEPQMKESGQNYRLRLETLQNIVQENPSVLQQMTPESQRYFQARVDHLQNQIQQEENAQIGRTMGQRVQDSDDPPVSG